MNTDIKALPYSATSVSVLARFIFMFLLYKNKSTNSLSLTFCILNVLSSSMWIYYSYQMNDTPMIVRSGTELVLLVSSAVYIIINKLKHPQVPAHQDSLTNIVTPMRATDFARTPPRTTAACE
ncbi:hypothetical protein EBZ80_11480 [bacterium]|nr:hypothetical protein [bacterium]